MSGSVSRGGLGDAWSTGAAIPPGSHARVLPWTYLAKYPASQFPFDDPRAEWIYLRSRGDPNVCGYYSDARAEEYQDDLISIAVVPYLAYELRTVGYLDTPAGYLLPQVDVRILAGMIVSIQNLDHGEESNPDNEEGGRVVELFSRVNAVSARIRTLRRDGGRWVGRSSTETYQTCGPTENFTRMVDFGSDGKAYPSAAYRADQGSSSAVVSNLRVGIVRVTGYANQSLTNQADLDEMLRVGFECLVGDEVEFLYSVGYRNASGGDPTVQVSRCMTFEEMQPLCDFLDEVDELQDRDIHKFVFQRYDDATLQADSWGC